MSVRPPAPAVQDRPAPEPDPPTPDATTGRGRRALLLPAAVAVLSAGVFALVSPHLIDDSYITFAYARNLAFHGHWGLIASETSNTATSPLNVLVLAAFTVILRNAVLAAGAVFVASQVVLALALRRVGARAGLPRWFAPVTMALLTVNPLLLSSVGLEVALGAAGVGWLLVYATERRPALLGVAVGLLALVRLDLLVIAIVVVVARRRFWARLWLTAAVAAAVCLPWFVFSWFALGSAVPDTLIIKTLQKSWGPWSFGNGPRLYTLPFPYATWLSFLPAGFAVLAAIAALAAVTRRGPVVGRLAPFGALVPAGALHYLAYTLLGVPPYHWYYGPAIVTTTIFLAAAVAALAPRPARLGGLGAALLLVVASAGWYSLHGLPREYAPILSNHASTAQYAAIGADLRRIVGDHVVRSGGEIGVLAYTCDCSLIDLFDDRGAVGPAIAARTARFGGLARALVDLNFRHLDRSKAPMTADYALVESHSTPPPPDPIARWTISSPWAGTQTLYLVRGNGNGG